MEDARPRVSLLNRRAEEFAQCLEEVLEGLKGMQSILELVRSEEEELLAEAGKPQNTFACPPDVEQHLAQASGTCKRLSTLVSRHLGTMAQEMPDLLTRCRRPLPP